MRSSIRFSIIYDRNNIYLVKGDSTLSIIRFTKPKLIVYVSTAKILYRALTESNLLTELKAGNFEEVKISCGDILKICHDGRFEKSKFAYKEYI